MAFNLRETANKLISQYGNAAQQASRGIPDNSYRAINEPQHAYCWEFTIQGMNADQDVRLFAQEVTIPSMEQEPVIKEYRGKRIQYQGKNSSPLELDVTFYDTQSLPVYRFLYMWFRLMNEIETNSSVDPSNYMKQCKIVLLDTTEKISTGEVKFSEVFPVSLGEVSLDYDSSEVMKVNAKLSYFDAEFGNSDTSPIAGLRTF